MSTSCTEIPEVSETSPAPEAELPRTLLTAREYIESIAVTGLVFLFITTFVLQAYKIPTGSMEKNLLIGDHLLVNKFTLSPNASFLSHLLPVRDIRRGDVIVFKYPKDPTMAYVKRVIGLPGEEIEIVGRTVFINGKALAESYTQFLDEEFGQYRHGPIRIPPNRYFAMGDNRDNSQDSRYWGFVPRDLIMGKAFLVYWSFVTDHDEYRHTAPLDRLQQVFDVALHFVTKTRWERTLRIVR